MGHISLESFVSHEAAVSGDSGLVGINYILNGSLSKLVNLRAHNVGCSTICVGLRPDWSIEEVLKVAAQIASRALHEGLGTETALRFITEA